MLTDLKKLKGPGKGYKPIFPKKKKPVKERKDNLFNPDQRLLF